MQKNLTSTRRKLHYSLCIFACVIIISSLFAFTGTTAPTDVETITTSWGGDAEMIYDTGFMNMLMKHPDGGVSLFNMELIENESPGSGHMSTRPTLSQDLRKIFSRSCSKYSGEMLGVVETGPLPSSGKSL